MSRAFAPHPAANGGGGMLNVLSVLSWLALPEAGAYCARNSPRRARRSVRGTSAT
jgi:short-subunit dehydrogenase